MDSFGRFSNSSTFNSPQLGQCHICNKNQSSFGKDGLWIAYDSKVRWICYECKHMKKISSYPVACEWCNYNGVKWYQGHTYDCPRCKSLNIKH